MRKLLTILGLFICFCASAQLDTTKLTPNNNASIQYGTVRAIKGFAVPVFNKYSSDTSSRVPGQIKVIDTGFSYTGTDGVWRLINPANYIQKQTQNPTATLTGGETRELMSSGADLSYTLSWSAGRTAATTSSLATANISNIFITPTYSNSNPVVNPGSTINGTYAVSVVRNTNTTFTDTVTTADSKIATASTSVIFQPKRYWFYSTSATPGSSDVVAALGGGSELSTSISKSGFTVTISGTNKSVSYASPSNEGHVTSIKTGGNIETIDAFTERTVSVTNSSGYVQNYYVLTSNTLYSNTTFTFDSVQ